MSILMCILLYILVDMSDLSSYIIKWQLISKCLVILSIGCVQNLLLVLFLRTTPRSAQGTTYSVKDQTMVIPVQSMFLT